MNNFDSWISCVWMNHLFLFHTLIVQLKHILINQNEFSFVFLTAWTKSFRLKFRAIVMEKSTFFLHVNLFKFVKFHNSPEKLRNQARYHYHLVSIRIRIPLCDFVLYLYHTFSPNFNLIRQFGAKQWICKAENRNYKNWKLTIEKFTAIYGMPSRWPWLVIAGNGLHEVRHKIAIHPEYSLSKIPDPTQWILSKIIGSPLPR